jgi:hypothetical protein
MNYQEINKEMTVYDLAQLMMQGFDRVDQRFDEVHQKFDEVHQKIDDLRYDVTKFERHTDSRLDSCEHRLIITKQVIEEDLNTKVRW